MWRFWASRHRPSAAFHHGRSPIQFPPGQVGSGKGRRGGGRSAADSLHTIAIGLALVPGAAAEVIHVPADQPTIQSGINAAVNGDEVVIAPGIYFEHISHVGKAITVRGSTGAAEDVIIDGAGVGPVVAFLGGEGPDSVIADVTVQNGFQAGWGGGVMIWQTSPTVRGCLVRNNEAGVQGGGIAVRSASAATIIDVELRDNIAADGAGLFVETGAVASVESSRFLDNTADGGGGACVTGTAAFTGCRFAGNTVASPGAAVDCRSGGDAVLVNCAVWGNDGRAALAASTSATLTVVNCTIVDNVGGFTGGLYNAAGAASDLSSCLVWGNSPGQILHAGGTTTVGYSLVEGGWPGIGNVDDDPLLVDPASGDLKLLAGSPCIDAGDNSAVPPGVLTDLEGFRRLCDDPATADTGAGTPPVVDMGCHEFSTCAADLECSGTVGIGDLLEILGAWGPCPAPCPPKCVADVNGDCAVDVNDLLVVLGAWGQCP